MHRGNNWGYEGERGCEYTGETTGVIMKEGERGCEYTGKQLGLS